MCLLAAPLCGASRIPGTSWLQVTTFREPRSTRAASLTSPTAVVSSALTPCLSLPVRVLILGGCVVGHIRVWNARLRPGRDLCPPSGCPSSLAGLPLGAVGSAAAAVLGPVRLGIFCSHLSVVSHLDVCLCEQWTVSLSSV